LWQVKIRQPSRFFSLSAFACGTAVIRLLFLVGAMSIASSAFAALNMYLKFEHGRGGPKKIVHCPEGTCTVSDLAPGDYTVSVCTKEGGAVSSDEQASHTITSPRDPASGQATGKRQHKPHMIVKEWSASSPMLRITVEENGSPVVLKCTINTTRSNIKK
jgi:hypothetical protein